MLQTGAVFLLESTFMRLLLKSPICNGLRIGPCDAFSTLAAFEMFETCPMHHISFNTSTAHVNLHGLCTSLPYAMKAEGGVGRWSHGCSCCGQRCAVDRSLHGVMRGRALWQASRGQVFILTKVALIRRLKSCVRTVLLERLNSRLFL